MPVYSYLCTGCNQVFEKHLSISVREQPTQEACPSCGELKVTKTITAVGISLNDMPKASGDWKNLLSNLKKKNTGHYTKSTINDNPGG